MHCNQFQKQFPPIELLVAGHNTSKEGAVERPQVATARGSKRAEISEDSVQRKFNFQ